MLSSFTAMQPFASPFGSKCVGIILALKLVKGSIQGQCLLCPHWITVETWQRLQKNITYFYFKVTLFKLLYTNENLHMIIISHFYHILLIDYR